MKLLERIKASLKHKHEWQEDQWGKRCQVCGRTRTKSFEERERKLHRFERRVVSVFSISMLVSALILLIIAPKGQLLQTLREFWFMGNTIQWAGLYLALFFWGLSILDIFKDEPEEKT